MTITQANASPVRRREQRIADLEALAARVADELATERAALRRVSGYRAGATVNVVPKGTDSRTVRAWARAHGWPNLGDRGRMPAAAITAYLTAANPGATR